MSVLDTIRVKVEGSPSNSAQNAVPLLHEIRHALDHLAATGESTTIDLSSLPFGPDDKEQLLNVLGRGEVEATVDAMGPTHIRETAFPGVWLVEHQNPDALTSAQYIEITRCPTLLATPEADVADAAAALAERLSEAGRDPDEQ